MSSNQRSFGRGRVVAAGAVAAGFGIVALAVVPARAAYNIQFVSDLQASVISVGDVDTGGGSRVSDETYELRLDLGLTGERPGRSWTLNYSPSRQIFSDNSRFDNTSHTARGEYRRDTSRLTQMSLRFGAAQSQRQGVGAAPVPAPAPVSFVPRTDIDRYDVDLSGQNQVSRQSFIAWSGRAAIRRLEDPPGINLEDSDTYAGRLGWGRVMSEKTTLGIEFGYQTIEFETRPTTESKTFGLRATRRFGKTLSGTLSLGVVESDVGGETATDPSIDLSLSKDLAGNDFSVGVSQSVSSGTGQSAGTLDRGAHGSWTRTSRTGRVRGGLTGGYWRRESLETLAGRPGTEAWSTGGEFSVQVHDRVTLGVSHSYSRQEALRSGTNEFTTDYHTFGGNVRVRLVGAR